MRVALVLGLLVLATAAAGKDLVVRQRSSTAMSGQRVQEETVYLTDHVMVTDSDAMRTIVDLDKQTITTADKTRRSYAVLTFDELRAQLDTLRASLDKLPPEVRKQVGGLLDDSTPVSVTATGKTDTIAGYSAKEYALSGGPYRGTIWTTDAIPKPPAFAKWKSIEKSRGGAPRQLGEAVEKLEGFPLRTRIEASAGAQSVTVSNEVLDVREASPPPEVRTVPAGFTKQAAPGAPAGKPE